MTKCLGLCNKKSGSTVYRTWAWMWLACTCTRHGDEYECMARGSVRLGGVCVVRKMADVEYFTTPGSQYSLLSANDIEYGIC